jgi:hypothetical protein
MLSNTELKEIKLKSPIFITGCSRSGTTLLRNILIKNNQIFGLEGETFLFVPYKEIVYRKINGLLETKNHDLLSAILTIIFYGAIDARNILSNNELPEHIISLSDEIKKTIPDNDLSNILDTFDFCAKYLTFKERKFRWIEKTPAHIFNTAFILKRYSDAQIIHIHRDPRAVYASWKSSSLPFFKNSSIQRFLSEWVTSVKIGLDLQSSIPNQFYMLSYSDLIKNPKIEIKKICDFLNEEYSAEMLDITVSNSSYNELLTEKGISDKPDKKWINILAHNEKLFIDEITKELRNKLGYPDISSGINIETLINLIYFHITKRFKYYNWHPDYNFLKI